jgi:hypothetical protein
LIRLNWKQAFTRVIGYIAMIIAGVLTQFTTDNPIATFAVTFVIGFAVSRISGMLANKKTARPRNRTSRTPRQVRYGEPPTQGYQRRENYATPPGFEPRSFKTKYMGGHSSHPKDEKVTLTLLGDCIEIPELRLIIPYHSIRDVEAIAHKGLKNLAFEVNDFIGIIILVIINSAIWAWSSRRKRYVKITYIDGRGTTQTPAFKVGKVDEVEPLIHRMMTHTQAKTTNNTLPHGTPPALGHTAPSQPSTGPTLIPAQNYTTQTARPAETSPTFRAPKRPEQVTPPQETPPRAPPSETKTYRSEELMAAFRSMRDQYDLELITEEGFTSYVQELRFTDDSGNPWMIGKESGAWYTHDGDSWRPREPPETLVKTG